MREIPQKNMKSLRNDVIARYISTSQGIHRHSTAAEIDAFISTHKSYLKDWIPGDKTGRWLDLGCGQGQLLKFAKSLGYSDAEGVDLSDEMLVGARQEGLRVRRGDVFEAVRAAPNDHYSIVSCFDILEHFPKEQGYELVTEIFRIIKPGGLLLTRTPNAYSPWGMAITCSDLTHDAAYTEATLLQMGLLAGFSSGNVKEAGPVALSVTGAVRTLLWKLIRTSYQFVDIVETGRCRTHVYTRVFFTRLLK